MDCVQHQTNSDHTSTMSPHLGHGRKFTHTRTHTHVHTHIPIHKQSFRERLDDGDFQYALNVVLIILSSQVEKLDHLKPSTLLQSYRFYQGHQQFLPIFILTKKI